MPTTISDGNQKTSDSNHVRICLVIFLSIQIRYWKKTFAFQHFCLLFSLKSIKWYRKHF